MTKLHASHSMLTALLAAKIAGKITYLSKDLAFMYGSIHDVGKSNLSKEDSYKHPIIGYNMFKNDAPDLAKICISHPFPLMERNPEYVLFYCKNDDKLADEYLEILRRIKVNNYIELIQLCDKLSADKKYVKLDDKFRWYRSRIDGKVNTKIITRNFRKYTELKNKFNKLTGNTIEELM